MSKKTAAPTTGATSTAETNEDFNRILAILPDEVIPRRGNKAWILLGLLLDGLPHTKMECYLALGNDPRGPYQSLTGEEFGFWLIHNIANPSALAVYQLDQRHLTGLPADDASARLDAEIRYRMRSRRVAQRETVRLGKALTEFQSAIQKKQEAANDE